MAESEVGTFAEQLDRLARRIPQQAAIIDDDGHHSYAELWSEAEAIASSLLALGVRRGEAVACLMRNRARWVACCMAAAKVGALFVPLNTWYRPREVRWTLRHTNAVVLLSESKFLGHDWAADLEEIEPSLASDRPGELHGTELPALRALVYDGAGRRAGFGWHEFLDLGRTVTEEDRRERQAACSPDDPLFVLYTSGSTGDPKGVVLAQGPLLANGKGIGDRRGVVAGDKIWLGSPFFYGLAAANALPVMLTHEATLVVQDRFDEERALTLIETESCAVFYGMSNMIRRIYESPGYHRSRVDSLQKGSAGIEIPERRLLLVEMGVTGATTSYGSTELCGNCLMGDRDDPLELKLTAAGYPLPGFEARVVDPGSGRPLAPGEIGLLMMRGHSAGGYLHNQAETAAAWNQDGFYDTGDLGSLGRDGYFTWHSRLKEMVKTGGINVSPAEIEMLLQTHPAISEAYVVGVPDQAHGEVPVAFVVSDGSISEASLRAYVKSIAASFKVPAQIFFRQPSEIHRTPSGKAGRPALKAEAVQLHA